MLSEQYKLPCTLTESSKKMWIYIFSRCIFMLIFNSFNKKCDLIRSINIHNNVT
uniref:Uncharacterized protein n=1 Tax=Anguilla anguilla TaxID=7936 RepID=A0A0E9WZI4_ANGAN